MIFLVVHILDEGCATILTEEKGLPYFLWNNDILFKISTTMNKRMKQRPLTDSRFGSKMHKLAISKWSFTIVSPHLSVRTGWTLHHLINIHEQNSSGFKKKLWRFSNNEKKIFISVQLEIKKDNTLNEGSIHGLMNLVKFYLSSHLMQASWTNNKKKFPFFYY